MECFCNCCPQPVHSVDVLKMKRPHFSKIQGLLIHNSHAIDNASSQITIHANGMVICHKGHNHGRCKKVWNAMSGKQKQQKYKNKNHDCIA